MFQLWLNSKPAASWADIIRRAVEQLGHLTLAASLKFKHMGALTQQSSSSSSSASPAVDEIQASVGVVQHLQNLEGSYGQMLVGMRRLSSQIDLGEVRFFLKVTFDDSEFSGCNTFEDVLDLFRKKYIDTFNISYLERLATSLKINEMSQLISDYKKEKESFLREVSIAQFHYAVASRVYPVLLEKCAEIVIKIPRSLANNRTLKDMDLLAAKVFEEHHASLVRIKVQPGSILVSWQFPVSLIDKLEKSAIASSVCFAEEGVEEVTVAKKVVFTSDEKKESERVKHGVKYHDVQVPVDRVRKLLQKCGQLPRILLILWICLAIFVSPLKWYYHDLEMMDCRSSVKELVNISKKANEDLKHALEENLEATKINQNCRRELERFRNMSMELNERYNDAAEINSDYRRRLEVCRNAVLDSCHAIHVYSIEQDNAVYENAAAQSELNCQNLQKELKRTKEFCDKGVKEQKEILRKSNEQIKRRLQDLQNRINTELDASLRKREECLAKMEQCHVETEECHDKKELCHEKKDLCYEKKDRCHETLETLHNEMHALMRNVTELAQQREKYYYQLVACNKDIQHYKNYMVKEDGNSTKYGTCKPFRFY